MLDLDTCPECGYVNKNRPDICPSCGCNLAEHRKKVLLEMVRLAKIEEQKKIDAENEKKYLNAIDAFYNGEFNEAVRNFSLLCEYKDSKDFMSKAKIALFDNAKDEFNQWKILTTIFDSKDYLNKDLNDSICSRISELLNEKNIGKTGLSEISKLFSTSIGLDGVDSYTSSCKKAKLYVDYNNKTNTYNEALASYNFRDYSSAKAQFDSLGSFKDSKTKADDCQKHINQNIAQENRIRQKKDKIETFFQIIAYILPIIFTIIFAIILFANTKQLLIKGSFLTWCTLWVIFLIASLISSIVLLKTRFSDWSHDDIASRVSSTLVAIISIICSIIVFANSGKLESNFNPANQISLNATSKSTSTRESYYISKIYFNITNNSSVDVSSFYGEMKFYYLSSYIGSWNVTFNGDYASSSTKTAYVEFEEYSKEGNNLYSASFSSLHISFSITQMRFNDQYQVYQFNGSEFTVE